MKIANTFKLGDDFVNIFRWICGFSLLIWISILIIGTGISAINIILTVSAFVFIIDAMLYERKRL